MPRFILAYLRSGADAEGLVFVEKADGARDLRAVQRSGIIEEIFDNGYYLIAIDSERYVLRRQPRSTARVIRCHRARIFSGK